MLSANWIATDGELAVIVETSPAGHFRELVRALETGAPDDDGVNVRLTGDAARWLHAGLVDYEENDRLTLCVALELRRRGVDARPRQYARETRNEHPRRAFAQIEGKTDYKRTAALAKAVFQFETRTWPRVRYEADPPSRLTPAQREIFRAFKAYGRVPCSTSQLADIVR